MTVSHWNMGKAGRNVRWHMHYDITFEQGEVQAGSHTVAAVLECMAELIRHGMMSKEIAGEQMIGNASVSWHTELEELPDAAR